MEIILAKPRGFCAGVERAIEIVEKALKKYGAPVYVRHEIVHNKFVVDSLKAKGAIFVKELDEIPEGAITIFSAHGVSEAIENQAKERNLPTIDATCPLVTKVHKEAQRNESLGKQIILIGHVGHPEVEGTAGRVDNPVFVVSDLNDIDNLVVNDPTQLAYVTQTTLSVDDTAHIIEKLKEKFPLITGPDLKDICYATQNRQNAVRELAKITDLILVIGAANSSNSNRLNDLGNACGVPTYLISGAQDIELDWFENVKKIGITAGASAPEVLVESVTKFLTEKFVVNITTMDGKEEKIKFKLPEGVN
jgi:4-hydroxy-3-methylbut-2-enyl diphosphate reductase